MGMKLPLPCVSNYLYNSRCSAKEMEKYLQMKQTNLPDLKWLVSELVPSITKRQLSR